jgi:hypothetical protein
MIVKTKIFVCSEVFCSVLQEDAVAGVAVVGVEVAAVAVVVVELVDAVQATWVDGVVEVETEIVAVETAIVGIRALGGSLRETHISLGSFLEFSVQKEVL